MLKKCQRLDVYGRRVEIVDCIWFVMAIMYVKHLATTLLSISNSSLDLKELRLEGGDHHISKQGIPNALVVPMLSGIVSSMRIMNASTIRIRMRR